jgi:NAD(P)H-hydrate epimerase
MRLVSAAEMREIDRLTIAGGTPGHVLMERAGRGATRALLECFPHMRRKGRRAVICAGKGNNGGDGFVIARLLARREVRPTVVLLGRAAEVTGDAARNLRAYQRQRGRLIEVTESAQIAALAAALGQADVIIDAIFGTGLNSPVRGLHAEAIELINAAGLPVFAVDIPSGLHADTGQPLGTCVQAEATATFGFAKLGQVIYPGAEVVGRLAVVDIGITAEALAAVPSSAEYLEAAAVAAAVPVRRPDAHKGDCGHLLAIAGGFGKTGAPQLVARAAARAGAGLVTLVGPASLYPIYASGVIEVMTEVLPDRDGRIAFDEGALAALLGGKSAVVIGPGIGTHDDAGRVVRWLLAHAPVPLVLDADALTCLASDLGALRAAAAPVILTPHPGEMARLCGSDAAAVQADRVGVARRFAREQRCVLVLKGARTVIAAPHAGRGDGAYVWVNSSGNPGMASGGMGDVLAGILGGLLAQGLSTSEAACLGTYVHGAVADRLAAETGAIGLLASDVIQHLPAGLRDVWRHES